MELDWTTIIVSIIGGLLTGLSGSVFFARKAKRKLIEMEVESKAIKQWQELFHQVKVELGEALERIGRLEAENIELRGKVLRLEARNP